jgi:hypothetical protein
VKIDVEGHELKVLDGATKLLDTQRPTVLIEVEQNSDRECSLATVIEFFGDHGYRGEYLHKKTWHPIEALDLPRMRTLADRSTQHGYGMNLLLYARKYVHNFVFKPR